MRKKTPLIIKINAVISYILPAVAANFALKLFRTPRKFPAPERELEYLANAESKTLNCGIHIHEWNSSAKACVLLLHGWNGRGSQMAAFAEPLVAAGFRVIAMDGPAHGKSRDQITSPTRFSDALFEVHAEIGGFDYLVAHSFGAGASIIAISRGLAIKKVCLIASPSSYELVVQNYLNFTKISKTASKIFFDKINKYVGIPADQLRLANYAEKLKVPALIIHDQKDKDIPVSEGYDLAKHWPNCESYFPQDYGHVRILRHPEIIEKVKTFFSK